MKNTCPPGVSSCSMAVFRSGREVRVRKFCTSAGSPLYRYLLLFPGASFCQNLNIAPSLLCVCTLPLCNAGHFSTVVENTMLNYLPKQLLPPREDKKIPLNSVRDHPDFGLAEQLADAGF
uniref:Secreted protein n=1 Tax=Angiostrongylus cantonensis TaxID=6313 RepID=A0A0K0DIH3_ANGCA